MKKLKILIVDDRPENIKALEGLLEDINVDLFSAGSAEEALNLLLSHEFCLALLDVQMPRVNGFELARLIRGVKKHKALPIIFVTAHSQDRAVLLEGYGTGAVDLLFKPLDPEVVRGKVKVFVQLAEQSYLLKVQMQELESLRVRAEEANFAKSRFLANMSHEIRTPLGAVLGFSEILSSDSISSEEREKCSATIRRNGQLLLSLIDEILDLSKIEAGRLEFEDLSFSLNDLISDIEETLAFKANEKGLKLSFKKKGAIFNRYRADQRRLKQILLNLIGNAIKFTNSGEIKVEISSGSKGAGPKAVTDPITIRVTDTGIGLSEDQMERLFKPFSQADASTKRRFGGSGLGLVISKQLANAFGGDLSLESSELGKGSTFILTLDLLRDYDEKNALDIAKVVKGLPNLDFLKEKNILVVDDVEDNRTLIARYLKDTGAKINLVSGGEKAISVVNNEEIDLVLMDIQMPEMDGYEAVQEIRKLGHEGPVIAVTAHADREDYQRCIQAGCDGVVTKPLSRDKLMDAIGHCLN